MKTIRVLICMLMMLMLTGCPATMTTVPDKIPKPIINPELLKSCPEDLSQLDLTNGFSFGAVLDARAADSVQYRSCVCRVEKLRLTLCSIAETTCSPQLPMCTKINADLYPAPATDTKEKPK
jgi:hypothetical protein